MPRGNCKSSFKKSHFKTRVFGVGYFVISPDFIFLAFISWTKLHKSLKVIKSVKFRTMETGLYKKAPI